MLKKCPGFIPILLVEGAALMAVELMGAKIVAPFYGSSLYVWTAILGFTVLGLTLGYYLGGLLSEKKIAENILFTVLGISAVLVLALPYTAKALISLTSGLDLIPGICVTSLLLLLPPMLCFGIVGPIVVKLAALRLPASTGVPGIVYFISTLGGIIATFLFGFYLIPIAGLKICAVVTGLSLAALLFIYFFRTFTLPIPVNHQPPASQIPVATKKKIPPKTKPAIAGTGEIKTSIYLYAVLEGATVMAVELITARMLAPWFGSSLYVWAAVMAFTLLGLAFGYFLGGIIPSKYKQPEALWWTLLAAALFLLLMHFTAQQLTIAFQNLSIKTSVIFVCIALILPPLLFMGMVPVMLIQYVSSKVTDSGLVTGRIFTVSSASGILSLFIMGFYIIPVFGLTNPSIFIGIIVGFVPFFKLISQKKYAALLFIATLLGSLSLRHSESSNQDTEVRYYSEGLLGQVLVTDVNKYDSGKVNDRLLMVNRIGEAQIDRKTGVTKWEYPFYVASLCSKQPERSNMLMLGLGGGQIPNMLNYLKFNVDVVELDQRIVDVAQTYFYLDKNINVTVDDARHYLQTTTKTYDAIIIDVFHGDIAPPHMLSLESFKKARSLLNKNGFIIVNFFGYLNGNLGKPCRSIYKTMLAAGLKTKILPTTGAEEQRNSLLIGSLNDISFDSIRSSLSLYGKVVNIDTLFIDTKKLDLKNAMVFTDDKPSLDMININGVLDFRKSYTDIIKHFLKNGIPLFQ